MVAGAMATRLRVSSLFGRENADDLKALYAAEAGVNRAIAEWSNDGTKTWAINLTNIPVGQDPQVTYSLVFDPNHSINNFNAAASAPGPLGPTSVPPDTAYLVVEGRSHGRTRQVEALVCRGSFFGEPVALASDGPIDLQNTVTIRGLKSLDETVETAVEVYSTNSSAGPLITHAGGGSVLVKGNLSSNSSDPNSIAGNLRAPGVVTGRVSEGQSKKLPANIDITGKINALRSAGTGLTPTLAGSVTTLSPSGSNRDYFQSGGINYNGDLILDGTNLYVDGDLTINGGIRGKGTVFVKGQTTFKGDSHLQTHNDQGIAILSKGSVTLDGFDGTTYLRNFLTSQGQDPVSTATNGGVPIQYSEHLTSLTALTQAMQTGIKAQMADSNPYPLDSSEFLAGPTGVPAVGPTPVATLAFGSIGPGANEVSGYDICYGVATANMAGLMSLGAVSPAHIFDVSQLGLKRGHADPIRKIRNLLANPANTSEAFLKSKFDTLQGGTLSPLLGDQLTDVQHGKGLFGIKVGSGEAVTALRENLRTGAIDSLLDSINDTYRMPNSIVGPERSLLGSYWSDPTTRAKLLSHSLNAVELIDFTKLGESYFQGVIYTEADFRARNEVKLVGSLIAQRGIHLQNGVEVVYIPELSRKAGQSLGTVVVKQWLRR